jgi:RND family efflux transporter MFP subunit
MTSAAIDSVAVPAGLDPTGVQLELERVLQHADDGACANGLLRLLVVLTNARGAAWLEVDGGSAAARVVAASLQADAALQRVRLLAAWVELAAQSRDGHAQVARFAGSDWTLIATAPAVSRPAVALALDLGAANVVPFLAMIQLVTVALGERQRRLAMEVNGLLAEHAAATAEVVAQVAAQCSPVAGAIELAALLASATGATRVAVAKRGVRPWPLALSGLGPAARQTPVISAVRAALGEAQREGAVSWPRSDQPVAGLPIDVAHREVAAALRLAAVYGAPLVRQLPPREPPLASVPQASQIVGSVLVGWHQPPTAEQVRLAATIIGVVGPSWQLLLEARGGALRQLAARIAAAPWRAAAIAVSLAAALLLMAWPVPYELHARVVLEAHERRLVTAPFAGTLLESHARAGDLVSAGQLLATLDGRELRYEVAGLAAEHARALAQRDLAQAGNEPTAVLRAELEARRIALRLTTLRDRLAQLELRAPIAGVILAGDLARAQGAAVETGQVLFELASLDRLDAAYAIPASDVAVLQTGQAAVLRLDARVASPLSSTIERIAPRAEILEGQAVFVARAALHNPTGEWLPGMAGHGRVRVGQRALGWLLTRRVLEWLRVQLWI